MNNRTLGMENGALVSEVLDLDLALMEQIWNDLQGTVKRSTIQHQELGEVIRAFASVRIKTYVPIFVRRNTVRRLRAAAAAGSLEP